MPTVDYEDRLAKLWNTIQESDEISDRNRELFSRFKRDLRTEDYSDARIHKLLSHLKILAEWAEFDFDDATEDDLRDAVAWVQSRGNSSTREPGGNDSMTASARPLTRRRWTKPSN